MTGFEPAKHGETRGAWAPLLLFLAALLLGIFQLTHPAGFGFGHGWEMSAIAKNLAAEGAFANPFEPAITGPTAVVPPLYPAFLAMLIAILRTPTAVVLAATMGNILANAST